MPAEEEFEANLFDKDSGEPLKRFLPVAEVRVPEIRLSRDGSRLVVADYEAYFNGDGCPVTVNERCFLAFVNLTDAPAERILRFAQRWGMLGLCGHGEPVTGHGLTPRQIRPGKPPSVLRRCQPDESETIRDWQWYARQFSTILKLGTALRKGEQGSDTEPLWEQIEIRRGVIAIGRGRERLWLAGVLNTLLAASVIQPIASWRKQPTLHFGCRGGTTLFAALTFELVMAVADFRIAFCSYCHVAYQPVRRPRAGEANSCEKCRQLANAERVRRYRVRKQRKRGRSKR